MINKCEDIHCPEHAGFSIRGRTFTGTVIEAKLQKTATVSWERKKYLPKYERYEKRRTKLKAHNPECIEVKKGDLVIIKECRPISKTKRFVVIKKITENIAYLQKEEQIMQSKHDTKPGAKQNESTKS